MKETRKIIKKRNNFFGLFPIKFGWQAWELTDEQAKKIIDKAIKDNWTIKQLERCLQPYDRSKHAKVYEQFKQK